MWDFISVARSMPYRRLKLMLVGRHKKGKTSLLQQLIQQGQNSGHQSYWSHVVKAQRGVTPSTNGKHMYFPLCTVLRDASFQYNR